ncbi:response regulator [Marinobacter sp.]|uniref:response regulator transcription factor n=1 Tax=Marinobacter sp. TaxID=50741 RepID=UPI0035676314
MKILIVDDHQLFADALTITLKNKYADAIIDTCDQPRYLLDNRPLLRGYDLVILDQAMPHLDGLSLWHLIGGLMSNAKVLVCSGSATEVTVRRALQLKVNGFVDKSESVDQILFAIREVMAGRSYFSESFLLMSGSTPEEALTLTRQQLAILVMIQEGHSNKEIARQLFVSLNTVKTHLRLLYEKLEVANRTSCIAKARNLGLL